MPDGEADAHATPRPRVVVAAARVVVADEHALAAGVESGMGLAAARAIAPQLTAIARDAAREEAALEALACWAGGFTPRVVPVAPQALLLEIGGCLRYFGGAENILAAAMHGCAEQGFAAGAAVAPTPQGALWLAQARAAVIAIDMVMLAAALDALPLAPLDLPAATKRRLAEFGARTLGDARRLPRTGLARRIGAASAKQLGCAYGEWPDLRSDFVFPQRFAHALELPSPVEAAPALLFAARRLLAALAGWLSVRQAGIAACTLHLAHRHCAPTVVELRFAAATRDAGRLERVLRERLERLALPAAVESVRLVVDTVEELPGHSGTLFDGGSGNGDEMVALIERLRARLGEVCVHGLAVVAEHRPECASRLLPQGRSDAPVGTAPRPFWLLAVPEVISERSGRPWRNGPLRLLAGPERIESGWWQGEANGSGQPGDARRDYFVALTADARWAWVFRELRPPGGWFLHGWFA